MKCLDNFLTSLCFFLTTQNTQYIPLIPQNPHGKKLRIKQRENLQNSKEYYTLFQRFYIY